MTDANVAGGEVVVEADGREVAFSHPDKVFFPERGETKFDLVRYYRTDVFETGLGAP